MLKVNAFANSSCGAAPVNGSMTLVSNHHFPRHSHDQFSIGVIAFGAQRSWRRSQF
jgi:AraC-like protein